MKISALRSGRLILLADKSLKFHTFLKLRQLLYCSSQRFLSYNIAVGRSPTEISTALSLSENTKSCILGNQIHGLVCKLGLTYDIFSWNNLIKMYIKCGFMCNGLKVFEEMPQRNIVSWSLIISGQNESGGFELCLETFLDMMRHGLIPNEFVLGSVMKACADVGAYGFGLCVHCLSLKIGIEQNLFVGCATLNMYAKLGDISSAELVFACLEKVDIGCWNAMIGGYTNCGFGVEALSAVSMLNNKGVKMDQFTIVSALKACSIIRDLDSGKELHGFIVRHGLKFTVVTNALIDMYFVNGMKNSALKTFNGMQNKDIISWNTAFGGFSDENDAEEIVELIEEFTITGLKPNQITFSFLFRQCGMLPDHKLGLQFFSLAIHMGFLEDPSVISSIIYMFSQCELMEMVRSVFNCTVFKPISVWNQYILAYSLNTSYVEAFRAFSSLWRLGVEANEYTYSIIIEATCKSKNPRTCEQLHCVVLKVGLGSHKYISCSLIKSYIKLELLKNSFEIFHRLESVDMTMWGVVISTLVHQNHTYEAFMFLNTLLESGEKPDEFIFGSILCGCSSSTAYHQTKATHSLVKRMGFSMHVYVASAIIDAYAKCGDIASASLAFEQSCLSYDTIVFNSMIMAYAHHGLDHDAMQIFERMMVANLQPSQATFVSVISACGHKGLVEQSRSLFHIMKANYKMEPSPDTLGCLVDMLSRKGFLYDAQHVIESMPFSPWPAILRSLLSGCRIYENRELGKWAAEKLLCVAPQDYAAYVLLSKVYSEGNSWEDAAKIRDGMAYRGALKDRGCSRIEI